MTDFASLMGGGNPDILKKLMGIFAQRQYPKDLFESRAQGMKGNAKPLTYPVYRPGGRNVAGI